VLGGAFSFYARHGEGAQDPHKDVTARSLHAGRYLAYLGATVTILSLAFGTFTQQLLSVENYSIAAEGNVAGPGNMPRSQTWQQTAGDVVEGGRPFQTSTSIFSECQPHVTRIDGSAVYESSSL
jgi:hypothetical protein